MKLDYLFEKMANAENAKTDFAKAERAAQLPTSTAASFMQIVGGLGIVLGLLALGESVIFGATVMLSSGFVFAASGLQQSVYDIRTILLRERHGSSREAAE